jgi:hypothetical protein
MVDRTRTEEALRFVEGDLASVGVRFSPAHAAQDEVLVNAARAVVEAPEIGWCEEHDAQDAGLPDDWLDYCWHGFYLTQDTPMCRMVRVFLVPAEEEM